MSSMPFQTLKQNANQPKTPSGAVSARPAPPPSSRRLRVIAIANAIQNALPHPIDDANAFSLSSMAFQGVNVDVLALLRDTNTKTSTKPPPLSIPASGSIISRWLTVFVPFSGQPPPAGASSKLSEDFNSTNAHPLHTIAQKLANVCFELPTLRLSAIQRLNDIGLELEAMKQETGATSPQAALTADLQFRIDYLRARTLQEQEQLTEASNRTLELLHGCAANDFWRGLTLELRARTSSALAEINPSLPEAKKRIEYLKESYTAIRTYAPEVQNDSLEAERSAALFEAIVKLRDAGVKHDEGGALDLSNMFLIDLFSKIQNPTLDQSQAFNSLLAAGYALPKATMPGVKDEVVAPDKVLYFATQVFENPNPSLPHFDRTLEALIFLAKQYPKRTERIVELLDRQIRPNNRFSIREFLYDWGSKALVERIPTLARSLLQRALSFSSDPKSDFLLDAKIQQQLAYAYYDLEMDTASNNAVKAAQLLLKGKNDDQSKMVGYCVLADAANRACGSSKSFEDISTAWMRCYEYAKEHAISDKKLEARLILKATYAAIKNFDKDDFDASEFLQHAHSALQAFAADLDLEAPVTANIKPAINRCEARIYELFGDIEEAEKHLQEALDAVCELPAFHWKEFVRLQSQASAFWKARFELVPDDSYCERAIAAIQRALDKIEKHKFRDAPSKHGWPDKQCELLIRLIELCGARGTSDDGDAMLNAEIKLQNLRSELGFDDEE